MTLDDPSGRPPFEENGPADEVAKLVKRAAKGEQAAWNEIVDRFRGRVWSICRAYRLSDADAQDVFQQTWLRVLENLATVRDPARLGSWISTTCRHEALAVLRRARRLRPTDDDRLLDRAADPSTDPEQPILVSDRNAELWRAFRRLSQRCQDILRILVAEVETGRPSYEMAAAALHMPVGSLGPSRGRCLAMLRKFLTEGIGGQAGAS
jgi:RNA polymerase sigma factor (sigma-70 family)